MNFSKESLTKALDSAIAKVRSGASAAAASAKAAVPKQVKDMVGSFPWETLGDRSDARNALIGSALGGLVLGGTSLAQDRDPEESRLAPVGDALVGALAGGAMGYGIPKGLSLFADPKSRDRLASGWRSYLGAAGEGAGYGALGLLGTTVRDFAGAARRVRRELLAKFDPAVGREAAQMKLTQAEAELARMRSAGASLAELSAQQGKINDLMAQIDAFNGASGFRDSVRDLVKRINEAKAAGDKARVAALRGDLRNLRMHHFRQTTPSLSSVVDAVFNGAGGKKPMPGGFWGNTGRVIKNRFHSRGYGGHPVAGFAAQAGKMTGGGALLGLALQHILGQSMQNNYKE